MKLYDVKTSHAKYALMLACASVLAGPPIFPQQPALHTSAHQPSKFDFQAVNVAQVIQLVYGEALKQPYVIDPAVLQDQRMVSFRFDASQGDLHQFWRSFLDALGFAIETRNGVDFVQAKPKLEKPEADKEVFVYHPKYRDTGYLTEMLGPIFKSGFTANRTVRAAPADKSDKPAPTGSAAALVDRDADTLLFQGSKEEVVRLKALLPQIDTAPGEVMVSGVVYEVSTTQSDGSAFSLALNLLGGKLSLNLAGQAMDNALHLHTTSVDAVLSALASDSRFKVVTSPRLRVRSGASSRLTVGQDVPTLGAVSYPQSGGTPVRSVEYRSSGVIFDLTPTVRDSGIELNIDQQLSNFVQTTTGVNDSPTLIKRELHTTVGLESGEVIVLGGLTEDKTTEGQSGLSLLPKWLRSASSDASKTELLLVLRIERL